MFMWMTFMPTHSPLSPTLCGGIGVSIILIAGGGDTLIGTGMVGMALHGASVGEAGGAILIITILTTIRADGTMEADIGEI